ARRRRSGESRRGMRRGANRMGERMRAKAYVAGLGTTGALIGAIGCAFAVLSAVVPGPGRPLPLPPPDRAAAGSPGVTPDGEPLPQLRAAFIPARVRDQVARDALAPDRRRVAGAVPLSDATGERGPLARAFEPAAGSAPGARGSAPGTPVATPAGP